MRRTAKTVNLSDAPPDDAKARKYRESIKRAKANIKDRPGRMDGTPRFDQLPTEEPEPPSGVERKEELSDQTVAGLEALRQQQELIEQQAALAPPAEDEEEPEELSEEDRLRQVIESRLEPIDIGQYFMGGGSIQQTVPIIPGKLTVRFRSCRDLEEVFVDVALKEESSKTRISDREFVRRSSEWALATHIVFINDTKWETIYDGDGTVSQDAMKMRMDKVRMLDSLVFNLLSSNVRWFMERVNDALTLEALGNG